MAWNLILFCVVLSSVSFANTNVWPNTNLNRDRSLVKRQAYDELTSSEAEQRRVELTEQLRLLNQRRRHRYDKDRKCCERSLEAENSVEDSPCCQRVQNQKCPHRDKGRCGVPAPQYQNKKVTRIITVTDTPETFRRLERQLIAKLEEDLRQLRENEEQRVYKLEDQRRLEFQEELRREEDDEEARLVANERNRRMALEEELGRIRKTEIDRLSQLGETQRAELEAQLEAERREEERRRLKREEQLREELERKILDDDTHITALENERRRNLEFELQTERQNTNALRKKRHEERLFELENDFREQKKRQIDQINDLVEQRRREFEIELERKRLNMNVPREEIIEIDEMEEIPEIYNTDKQQCCNRCAGQGDRCRCNRSFVSCNGN
jgi:hypothetical protein